MIKTWGIKRKYNNSTRPIQIQVWAGLNGVSFLAYDINLANAVCASWNEQWPQNAYYVAEYDYQIEKHNV